MMPSLEVPLVPEEIFWSQLDQGALPPGSGYWTRNRPLPWSFQWHAANLVHCVSSGINRPEARAIIQESAGPYRIACLAIRTATPFFLSFPFYYSNPPLVYAQATGLMDAFLTGGASDMASDVAATRKRPSPSCEAGQLTIAESFGGAAVLSSTIADMIYKKGLCHSLSGDQLLNRVIKCARFG